MIAVDQIKDKNNGSNAVAIGNKNIQKPDLTKNAFAIQYKPKKNHPKANENDKQNTSFKCLALQIANIANEKQNIKG